jgi:penicillin amidase
LRIITMSRSRALVAFAIAIVAAVAGCKHSSDVDETGVSPGTLELKAETALPPGQSGFVSLAGQAQGTLTKNPADYGPHIDDQRLMYWQFDAKPAVLGTRPGTPETPKAGVQVYRDSYGVPIVYADNVHDLWFGVGYAVAHDRLFLMDAVRRTGAGTLAELTGCGTVPADIQTRVLTYSPAEYDAMFAALSQDAKDAVLGYVDGANAWIGVATTDPTMLPAEYALLTSVPQPFTVRDVLAAGVYITRYVAAEGGNEFLNIRMLKDLAAEYGSDAEGRKAFLDMTWLDDPKATTSVPASEGHFSNQAEPVAGREAVFNDMADRALALPETIWKGEGTGNAPPPSECTLIGRADPKQQRKLEAVQRMLAQVNEGLSSLRRKPTGASFSFAIGSSRTRDGGTLLISAPQLGYSYPLLLVEYEIHGAGYDARGVSVPSLPTVGIGYTPYAAWGLTTGYSKTIDSFIETICSNAQVAAHTCTANQYLHNGVWKDMECRSETVNFRLSTNGVPVGPPIFSTVPQVCRTIHGPIVARDDGAGLARSLQYAMFKREIETIEGIREWNRVKTFDEFRAATAMVTWNENVTVATKDGHIAYFHPGLFPRRNANTDMRLPIPGTGAYDFGPNLPFDELPHVVDPAQGFVANWNTKPAQGWLDGEGMGSTSRPGGPGQRVTNILDLLATRSDWTFASLRAIDIHTGTTDARAREYLPVLREFRDAEALALSDTQRAALDLVLNWDRSHFGPGIDLANETATDGPAATIFGEIVASLRDELFAGLKSYVLDPGLPDPDPNNPNAGAGITVFGRVAGVGSHRFDQSVMDNLVIRILEPSASGLAIRRDYTGGRSRDAVIFTSLTKALAHMATVYNGGVALTPATLDKVRRVHPRSQLCSLTGVIGPGSDTLPGTSCVTMPFEDRGSWVHRVGYEAPG